MAWDVRRTYYYLVCLVTLLISIFGGVRAVQSGLDMLWPEEPYRPTELDLYRQYDRRPGTEQEDVPYTREEIEAMADRQQEQEARRMRRRALRDLIGNLVLLAVALPVYRYHWRHVRSLE